MARSLNALIVEDSIDDAELIVREIERGGYDLKYERVETLQDMKKALDEKSWDIVLADYNLPHFSGLKALALVREREMEIPFILISGKIGEETAVDVMKAGANDYIMKDKLERLTPAVVRELGEVGVREELKQAEQEVKMRARLLDAANDSIVLHDLDGRYIYVNKATSELLGYSKDELADIKLKEINTPEYAKSFKSRIKQLSKAGSLVFESVDHCKDGSVIPVEIHARIIESNGEKLVLSVARDITERKKAEAEIKESLAKLKRTLEETVQAMALTVETRDPYTAGHQRRVSELALAIAKEMEIKEDQAEGLKMAAVIHDIGKLQVPAEILSKPGRITDHEFDIIKTHSKVGYEILKSIEFPWPIAQIALQHHERMDGSGYPQGLSGKDILLEAKILAVSDVVEAMSSNRPYRAALGIDKALEEIARNKGGLYDEEVADACLAVIKKNGFKFSGESMNE